LPRPQSFQDAFVDEYKKISSRLYEAAEKGWFNFDPIKGKQEKGPSRKGKIIPTLEFLSVSGYGFRRIP